MKTNHTPIPWHADAAGNIKQTATAKRIAVCDHAGSLEAHEANAEFITLACNHHASLVAALEKQIGNLLSLVGDPQNYCLKWIVEPLDPCACPVCEIRAILAKVKGQP